MCISGRVIVVFVGNSTSTLCVLIVIARHTKPVIHSLYLQLGWTRPFNIHSCVYSSVVIDDFILVATFTNRLIYLPQQFYFGHKTPWFHHSCHVHCLFSCVSVVVSRHHPAVIAEGDSCIWLATPTGSTFGFNSVFPIFLFLSLIALFHAFIYFGRIRIKNMLIKIPLRQ